MLQFGCATRFIAFAGIAAAIAVAMALLHKTQRLVSPALWSAIVNRNALQVRTALKEHPNLEATDASGWTPLLAAAGTGEVEIVKMLLDGGADVDGRAKGGWTPLLFAARKGRAEVVRLLVKHHANPSTRLDGGSTLLHQAVTSADLETLSTAIELVPQDVNRASFDGATPVYVAAFKGHLNGLKLLLDAGGDPNKGWPDGFTPMHAAAQHGYVEVVRLLHLRGANIDARLNDGCTPIDLARQAKKEAVVRYLQERGGKSGQQAGSSHNVPPLEPLLGR